MASAVVVVVVSGDVVVVVVSVGVENLRRKRQIFTLIATNVREEKKNLLRDFFYFMKVVRLETCYCSNFLFLGLPIYIKKSATIVFCL